jgi:hypothetical protein
MADISMCQYSKCPKSNECYRFLAPVNQHYQSYARFQNICSEDDNYQWFWQADKSLIKKEDENNIGET